MKNFSLIAAVLVAGFVPGGTFTGPGVADAQTYNDVQSNARPFGLDVVDLVQTRGTDLAAQQFLTEELPDLNKFIQTNFQERDVFTGREARAVDPSKLKLVTDANVRTYFVTEGAGYHNSLGFNVDASGVTGGDPKLIFPDASTREAFFNPQQPRNRSNRFPILPGDFVDLGTFSAGQQLDFFLISNGARGGRNVFTANAEENPDGLQHSIAFSYAVEDSPYLLIGFEDFFGGGDNDFNDLMFVVDVGVENARKLVNAPEPGVLIALGVTGYAVYRRRRKHSLPAEPPPLA